MKPKDLHNDKPNFKLPDGYFNSFAEELSAQIALEKVLGGKAKLGFDIPEGYFESFEGRMSTLSRKRILNNNTENTKVIKLNSKKWLWTAASIAAIALVIISVFPWSTAESPTFDSLEIAEIEAYVEDRDIAFSDYELGDMLTDDAFESLESTAYIEDAALVEYLENNLEDGSIFIE
ncbi:hypothetical protein [Dokdonia sinensis]|nr:hypothetical protein [Dokdonia sinensis]